MLHTVLYILHIFGMSSVILLALYLSMKKEIDAEVRKKLSLYLMSAAHTQLLTGFSLFFLLLSQINHMKAGMKMLLAISIAIAATLYRKKIRMNESPKTILILIVLFAAIAATIIAFLL